MGCGDSIRPSRPLAIQIGRFYWEKGLSCHNSAARVPKAIGAVLYYYYIASMRDIERSGVRSAARKCRLTARGRRQGCVKGWTTKVQAHYTRQERGSAGLNWTTGLKEERRGREGARPPDPHKGVQDCGCGRVLPPRTSSAACRGQHRLERGGGKKTPARRALAYY